MHQRGMVAQICLILSILSFVLASPIFFQEKQEAPGVETVVAQNVAARSTSSPSPQDEMASPLHSSSSHGSTSSDYLSVSENLPASSHGLASPHPSSGSSGLPPPWPWWLELLEPVMVPPSLHGSVSHPSSSGSSIPLGQGLEPPSPQFTGSDLTTSETYSSSTSETYPPSTIETYSLSTTETSSPSDKFTPSHRPSSSTDEYSGESRSTLYSSASGGSGSLSSHYLSALDASESVPSHHSMPEGLAPSHHLTPDGSPPTDAPPDDAEFFNENMMKKLKIVAGMVIIGGTIASIVGPQIKHRDYQDS